MTRSPVFPDCNLPISLGLLNHTTYDIVASLLDTFVEAGGTVLDTAWIYNNGITESLVGKWLTASGARDKITLVGKGAHTPHCDPQSVARELGESLDRMCTDYVDVYLMHRDNTDIPVGELVSAMHNEVTAGRVRGAVGGSNWTSKRFDDAIAYAEQHGLTVPSVLSNHFSLATMNDAIWPGTVSSASTEWTDWLTAKQVTNLAWSSQSRGFFTDRVGRDRTDDAEMVRVWHSEANFARRDRSYALAAELGRTPVQIALAYAMTQPFPQLAIVGPDSVAELTDSMSACSITLTPAQVAWLENGE